MRRLLISALTTCLLLSPLAAAAEDYPARHYARGLIEFHAERYPAALEYFDRAVAANPDDPYALYYRGVGRGRLGDWAGAETDLRRAIKIAPDLSQPRLELATALFRQSKYGEALKWFESAGQEPRLTPRAALYGGICRLRMGDTTGAITALSDPAADDPSVAVAAHYYRGVAYARSEVTEPALSNFRWVTDNAAGTEMADEAGAFIDSLEGHGAAKPYSVYGAVGFAYDSNVLLAPDDSPLDISSSEQADGRSEITVGGTVSGRPTDSLRVIAGYEFYQNLHFDLTDFDLQDHRLTAQLIWNANKRITAGLLTRYDYYFLDNDSFLAEGTLLPWVSVSQGSFGRTDFHYRYRIRDYRQAEFENALNGDNQAFGFRQYKYFGTAKRYLSAGYQYVRHDLHDTDNNMFAYDAHEAGGGIGWDLPWQINGELDYIYRYEDYDKSDSDGRNDNEHRVIFELRRPIHKHLDLIATYLGTFNDSNDSLFDYDRHIGSLTLEVTL